VPATRIEDMLSQQQPGEGASAPTECEVSSPREGETVAVLDSPGGPLQVTAGTPIPPVSD